MPTDPNAHQNTPPDRPDVLPPDVSASVFDVPSAGKPVTWWVPGWRDVARSVPWWWWPLASCSLLALFLAAFAIIFSPRGGPFLIFSAGLAWNLAFVAFPAAIALTIYATARATRARADPFCIHCGYSLVARPTTGLCPECGSDYDTRLCAEYRKDPHFFRQRWHAARRRTPSGSPMIVPPDAGRGDGL